MAALFQQDMLGDDLEAWMAESSLLRRTFRNVAVIAGLVDRAQPGADKNRRQVTVNTDLIYDVLRRHQPDHILLRATRADAARGLTDVGRLAEMLARVQGQVRTVRLSRVSPLAVPVLLDIGREFVRTTEDEDALLAETEALVAEATGEAETSQEPMRVHPVHRANLTKMVARPAAPPADGTASARGRRRPPGGMTAAPIHLAGHRLMLDPAGALWWPERHLLAVADLHLEKGSACAVRGHLVPPWDTRATLDRLALLLRRYTPRTVLALGDSFHDTRRRRPADGGGRGAAARHGDGARLRLAARQPRPAAARGHARRHRRVVGGGGIVFRHQAGGGAARGVRPPPSQGQRRHPRADHHAALLRRRAAAPDAAGLRRLHRRAGRAPPRHRAAVPARRPRLPAGPRAPVRLHAWQARRSPG